MPGSYRATATGSAGWADVGGLARRGGIYAARDVCGGGNSAGRIYAAPTNRSEKWRLRLARRGGIHAARDVCGGGNSAGRIYAAPTNRSKKWRLRLVGRGGIQASREPCAAANTPGGINPSPTHCPQTTACMTGRRGRRPLRRAAFLFVPPGTNSTFFIIYYLLSLIYLLFAPFVV